MANLKVWALLCLTLAVESFVSPLRENYNEKVAFCSSLPQQSSQESFHAQLMKLRQESSGSAEEALALVDDLLIKESPKPNRQVILKQMKARYQADCRTALSLAVEEHTTSPKTNTIPFEWVKVGKENYSLAVQSLEPILNRTSVNHLRAAAESLWQQRGRTSRFTYQRAGNYEVHVSDLPQQEKSIVNECLVKSIYPLIHHVFWKGDIESSSSNLCVYDALIIRYNATEAAIQQASPATYTTTGAGQPLHRDLGIVSINIMLNSANDFCGGGTFFENQLRSGDAAFSPLKPKGVGHCLAHYSTERHAGSATLKGVRDILVLFVTAVQKPLPPKLIQSALLKQGWSWCQYDNQAQALVSRIHHHRLALDVVPNDGEAWQYLGTALMEYYSNCNADPRILDSAKDCFLRAAVITPFDSRIYNNLALTLERLQGSSPALIIERAFEYAWSILDLSKKVACDVEQDMDALALNYGLYLSKHDRFDDACRILHHVAKKKGGGRIVEDAYRLWEFCNRKREQIQS